MITLNVDRNWIISLDIGTEKIYAQILTQKNRLLVSHPEAAEFLDNFPTRLLRKAAKWLLENPQTTAYQFVHEGFALDVYRDMDQSIRVTLKNFRQP